MLTELAIKNLILIEEVRLDLSGGFSVFTGETGAGKSILVGAIGLLLGEKASPGLIRPGATEAVVEGIFSIEKNNEAKEFLEALDLEGGAELVIRRVISTSGKNRIYVNGMSVSLGQLRDLAELLIDLSSQHEHQVLLNTSKHLEILDNTIALFDKKSVLQKAREKYLVQYDILKKALRELSDCQNAQKDKANLEFLQFQLNEIKKANLTDDEEEDRLLRDKAISKNTAQLSGLCEEILTTVEDTLLPKLHGLAQKIDRLQTTDESLSQATKIVQEVLSPAGELARYFQDYRKKFFAKPVNMDQIESRLYAISQLKRKYGASVAEIRQTEESLQKRVDAINNGGAILERLTKVVNEEGEKALVLARELSKIRRQMANVIETSIEKELVDLSMKSSKFEVGFIEGEKGSIEKLTDTGFDRVEFLLSVNPGLPPKSLVQIASGGELSRILLAIKAVLARGAKSMVLIFDEIDTGIGGSVAETVGQKIKELSYNHQVLCVTHLAQIAAQATQHFVIEKLIEGKQTNTRVVALPNIAARTDEIARMLGGINITAKIKAHAKELLDSVAK